MSDRHFIEQFEQVANLFKDPNTLSSKWNDINDSLKDTWEDLSDDDQKKIIEQKDKFVEFLEKTYEDDKEIIDKVIGRVFERAKNCVGVLEEEDKNSTNL
ncbi:MAG: hypothetical protein K2P93_08605 [Alphaproteobacteria bacterium]|nr:hypothetical protein [Alphaproteobacteria bacterium]